MGLLTNRVTLQKINDYLQHTSFGTQNMGHMLALSFLPKALNNKLQDKRYSFQLRHRLFENKKDFSKVTYSEVVVGIVLELTDTIKTLPEHTLKMYTDFGLIKDDKCTKELVSTVIANVIAVKPSMHNGNTTNSMKYSDNLQNIFPEFQDKNITYFLNKLDNYKQI